LPGDLVSVLTLPFPRILCPVTNRHEEYNAPMINKGTNSLFILE